MSRTYTSERARFETENIQRQTNAALTWRTKYGTLVESGNLRKTPHMCPSPPRSRAGPQDNNNNNNNTTSIQHAPNAFYQQRHGGTHLPPMNSSPNNKGGVSQMNVYALRSTGPLPTVGASPLSVANSASVAASAASGPYGTASPPRSPQRFASGNNNNNNGASPTSVHVSPSRRHFTTLSPTQRQQYYATHIGRPGSQR
eukprot:PhM_4_TR8197/c0_g1_i1/m.82019